MPNLLFRSQTNGNDSTFTVSSVSATLPTGTVIGDLMLIWVSVGAISPTAAPTISTPAGWIAPPGGSGTASIVSGAVNIRIHLFYKEATASEGSATLSAGVNSAFGWGRLSYQNPDRVTPYGQVTFGSGAASTSAVLTGITTGAANAMINTFLTQGVAQLSAPPASMTERIDNATAGFEVADEIIPTAGATGNRTFTLPTSSDHAWGFAEFRSSNAVTGNIMMIGVG